MYILCAYPLPNNPIVGTITDKNRKMMSMGWARKYYDKVVLGVTESKEVASSFFGDQYSFIMEDAVKDVFPLKLKEVSQFRMVEDINVFITSQGCSMSVKSPFFNAVVNRSGFTPQCIHDNTFFLMLGRGKQPWTTEEIQQVSEEITDETGKLHIKCMFTPNQWGLCIIDSIQPDVTLTSVGLEHTIPQLYVTLIMAAVKPEDLDGPSAPPPHSSRARFMDI